jgi:RNA polymerase sigma-B factor
MATLSIEKVSARPAASRPAGTVARGKLAAQRPSAAARGRARLAALEDRDLLAIVRSQPVTSSQRASACEQLVARYRNLVRSCVRRYQNGPEQIEDLMQVGYVGLMKAINNFDPDFGTSLAAYAEPCITGEIKRHFRDKRWLVHVERPMQELVLKMRDATGQLNQQLGHSPSDSDLANRIGTSDDSIRQARLAKAALQPWSLDAPLISHPDAASLADLLGTDDPNIELAVDLQALAAHWGELPEREQQILVMRFYEDMTQAQIGAQLGVSQMQVSRLLAHAFRFLRERILADADTKPIAA